MDDDVELKTILPDPDELTPSCNSMDSVGDSVIFIQEKESTSTKRGACCNYINLTVGGGVVGIPKACKYMILLWLFH